MAITGASDTIKILFSAKMDAKDVLSKTKQIEAEVVKSQRKIDSSVRRIGKLQSANSKVRLESKIKELNLRHKIISTEQKLLLLSVNKLQKLRQESIQYTTTNKALQNRTSIMASISGQNNVLLRQADELVKTEQKLNDLAETRRKQAIAAYKMRHSGSVSSGFSGLQDRGSKAIDQANANKALSSRKEQQLQKEQLRLSKLQEAMSERIAAVTIKVAKNINIQNRAKSKQILIGLRSQALRQRNYSLARKLDAEIKYQTKLIEMNTAAKKRNAERHPLFQGTGGRTTFSHKVITTAEYAAAGTGIYAVASAAREAIKTVAEFDTTIRTMSAVLGESLYVTRALGQELNELGKKFGGSQKEIYDIATELGRAGVATEDLTEATSVAIKMALLTGDSFNEAAKAIISYNTVFGKDKLGNTVYTVEQLGNKLAYVANVSRLTTQDIGTFSNYALAAAKSVNMTVDAVGAMAASFSNAGINASTIGTQIRSFTRILTDQSSGVQSLFKNMHLVQASVLTDIQKGGAASNAALVEFGKELKNLSDEDFAAFTSGLDIRARQSLATLRQQFGSFTKFLKGSANDSKGQLDETSVIIESLASTWERSLNRMKDATVDTLSPTFDWMKQQFNDMSFGMEWMAIQAKYAKDQKSFSLAGSINPIVRAMEIVNKLREEGASKAEIERAKELENWQMRVQMQKDIDELQAGALGTRAIELRNDIKGYQQALGIAEQQSKLQDTELEKRRLILAITDLGYKTTSKNMAEANKEIQRMVDLYMKLEDKKKSINKPTTSSTNSGSTSVPSSSESTTSSMPLNIDITKFSKSIEASAKARYDMTNYQSILNKLVKEQVDDNKESVELIVRKNLGLTEEANKIIEISKASNDYKETTLAIAKLQELSATATHRGKQTLADIIKYMEQQLSLQQSQHRSQQAINKEELNTFNDKVKVQKDLASITKVERDFTFRKISAIQLANAKLEQQKRLLVTISKIPVSKDNNIANKQKSKVISNVKSGISKQEERVEVLKFNARVKLEQDYYNTIESLAHTTTAKIFGYEKDQHFAFNEWRVFSEVDTANKSADLQTNIYYDKYLRERKRLIQAAQDSEISDAQKTEYLKAQNAVLVQKAVDAQQQTMTSPLASSWQTAESDAGNREGAADLKAAASTALLNTEFEDKMAILREQGATEAELKQQQEDHLLEIQKVAAERARDYTVSASIETADKVSATASNLANTLSDLQKSGVVKSRKAFEAMKAMQIAATIASTYSSATKAYSSMSGIPYVGPALGAAAAAAAIAAGMANVAQIKAQKFHTGGTVGANGQKLRSDEVPAILQTGERVLSRQDIAQAKQSPSSNEVVVINSIDPEVIENYMTSRSGRQVIKNVVNA